VIGSPGLYWLNNQLWSVSKVGSIYVTRTPNHSRDIVSRRGNNEFKEVGAKSIEHYEDWCAQAFERVVLRVATLSRRVLVLRVPQTV